MKFLLFAVLLVVAGSHALPRANEAVEPFADNPVEYRIRSFIERVIETVDSNGLDPLEVERRDYDIDVESLDVVAKAFVENVRFTGASDIRIITLEYSYLFNRLRLDVQIPGYSLTVGNAGLEASVAGLDIEGQLSGSLAIKAIRIAGVGYVDVNLIGQISVRSATLDCSIGAIESDLSVVARGTDYSEYVNTLLNDRLPNFLNDNKDDINRLLADYLSALLDLIWSW